MKKRKYFYTFDADDIDAFKFCPKCGAKAIHIYDGDYSGMIQCMVCPDDDDCIDFKISWEDVYEKRQ